jgi:hypothetical protein
MLVVTRRLVALSAAALIALGALGACTQPSPEPSRSTAPTVKHTPAFASDADALKAATDAYAAYLKMSDTIAHDGGANPERIKPYVTGDEYKRQKKDLDALLETKRHAVGNTTFDTTKLWKSDGEVGGIVSVGLYLCIDVSRVRLVDESGRDVTPTNRASRLPLQIDLEMDRDETSLRVNGSDVWAGSNFC